MKAPFLLGRIFVWDEEMVQQEIFEELLVY